jgi:adenylate cyclase
MAKLVARSITDPDKGWERTLPTQPVTLGRLPTESVLATEWDREISRRHAVLISKDGKLLVRRLPEARNKIFFHSEAQDEFIANPGEQFVIGQTTFTFEDGADEPSTPLTEMTIGRDELRQIPFADVSERIEVLTALPAVIRNSPSDTELEKQVVDVLLRGIPRAEVAAIARLDLASPADHPRVDVRVVQARGKQRANLRPSHRLVYDSIQRRRQSVMRVWPAGGLHPDVTVDPNFDWAMCVPLADEPSPGWGLYVTGRIARPTLEPNGPPQAELLKSDLKFAELVGEIFSALRQVLDLQRRQALLARFLSRPVLAAIAQHDINEVLRPRQTEVAVLFCDLRGSSRIAEEGQHELPALWERVSEALNIMAGSITDQDGVIGDFQGDAAMGFWGWPLPQNDAVERAARAALMIRRRFSHASQQPDHPLVGFACGIGIACGPAIAGRLGTQEQFKVDVFGPTVNIASRLESMTKQFRVPIVLDDATAQRLSQAADPLVGRTRRLARVQPFGMPSTVLMVHELLLPLGEPGALAEGSRRDHEAGLDAFIDGRWQDAQRLLNRLPGDGPAEFLKAFMQRHRYTPPAEWNGVIVLECK